MQYVVSVNQRSLLIEINDDKRITVDGVEYTVDFESLTGQAVFSLLIDGRSYEAYVSPSDEGWEVLLHGALYTVQVEDEREKRLRVAAGALATNAGGEFHLKAPMPGLIVAVTVAENQAVQPGDILVILESMKMQNELKAQRAGTVTRVKVKPGESVEQHQILITLS